MEKELNKKLAEWAGFTNITDTIALMGLPPKSCYCEYLDFTSSLDVCFKWLVPKLDLVDITTKRASSGPILVKDGYWASASLGALVQCESAETPALALCRAIEKLIEEEE